MDFETSLLDEFKRRLEQGDTAGALRCYKAMSPAGVAELDADKYIRDKMETLKTRLEELHQTQGGQEIEKLQEESRALLDLEGEMIQEMRSRRH